MIIAFDENAGGGTVLEFMGIQGRTYTIKGSADLKEWSELTFEV